MGVSFTINLYSGRIAILRRPIAARTEASCEKKRPWRVSALMVWRVLLLGSMVAVTGGGCATGSRSQSAPGYSHSLSANSKQPRMTPRQVQAQVMRFADRLISTVSVASGDLARMGTNAEARALARRFKTEQSASAVMIAGGLNPTANLLDMTAMVTLQRQSLEDYWVPKVYGDSAKPLLDTYTHLETDIWFIARQVLSPANQKELADIIQKWRARNPEFRYTRMIPFEEFARAAGQEPVEGNVVPGSLFGLLFLDPFARLDSTRRAIEQSEYLAERSMFYLQRMPELLQDHSQLMFYDFAQSPEVQNLQADIERFSRASEVFAEGVREFPNQVAEERLAAIQQILQGLATERTNFIAQLHVEADRLKVPLRDLRATMDAGSQMAGSVKSASDSLIAFTELVQPKGERTNSHPFDVREYGAAARDIGDSASQLTILLQSLNRSSPQFGDLVAQMQKESHHWVDYAVGKLLLLTLCIMVLGFVIFLWRQYLLEKKFLAQASHQSNT